MSNDAKSYDVFLSHAHVDADFVKKLADTLVDEHGLKVWLDQWVLVPGDLWQHDMVEGIDDAASCAVCIGSKTPQGWFNQEIQRALNRQSREPKFRVIPLILPGGDTSNVDNFLELRTWVDMRKGLDDEEALHKLVCGIQGIQPGRVVTKKKSSAPLFTVPLPDNPFFTERGNELAELQGLLEKRGIAALTGMGGMGKTQTASKYAYVHRDEYPAVLWVRAENDETLYADFTRLAALLNLPESTAQEQKLVVEAVKRWLDGQERWLLVLDNVVDLKFVGELTRKADPNGRHILVTTQSQATGAIRSKDLPLMDSEMGALLLLRRAGLIGPDAPLAEALPENIETARGICEKLGGLPLAIDQAGAYISETGCSLTDYRELLNDNLPELLARRGDLDNEHESVARTFVKSLEELAQRNPASADLVSATAFLAPDAIPEEIFTDGAFQFYGPLQDAASDKLAWNEAIGATLKFSLLDRDSDRKMLSVHRTVQAVVSWNMEEEEHRAWAEQVVQAGNAAFPDPTVFENWPRCERLLPHAQALAKLIDDLDMSVPGASLLLNQTAYYLNERARYVEAESLYRRALAIDEKALGPDHPGVATCLSNLAGLLRNTGRYTEAEPFIRRALAIDEKAYGPDHPDVAVDLNVLAVLLETTNRYPDAEPLYRRALAISEKALGPDHPSVAIRLNNLAQLLQDTNRLDEAEPLMRRALEIDEKSYSPDHPNVAIRLNNLAQLLQDTNRLAEAEPLMRRALAIDENSYGPDHPDVAIDLNNLAQLLQDTNRLAEAELLMRRALAIDENSYGPDHPSIARDLNNLARLLKATNRLAEAESLYRRGLEINEHSYGLDHPAVASNLNNLATLLQATNRLAEAEPLMRRALEIVEKSPGPDHPNTVIVRGNLEALVRARSAEA